MHYRLKTFEQDGHWFWDIETKDGEEVASGHMPFSTRQDARADGMAALSDFE